jgi:hypothetical protein
VFDEIPSPRTESLPNYRALFGVYCGISLISLTISGVRWWRGAMNSHREILAAEFAVFGLLSALFFMKERSAVLSVNWFRIKCLTIAMAVIQLTMLILMLER